LEKKRQSELLSAAPPILNNSKFDLLSVTGIWHWCLVCEWRHNRVDVSAWILYYVHPMTCQFIVLCILSPVAIVSETWFGKCVCVWEGGGTAIVA